MNRFPIVLPAPWPSFLSPHAGPAFAASLQYLAPSHVMPNIPGPQLALLRGCFTRHGCRLPHPLCGVWPLSPASLRPQPPLWLFLSICLASNTSSQGTVICHKCTAGVPRWVTGAQGTSKHPSSVQWWLWPLLVAVSSKGRWCDLLGFITLSRVKTAEEPAPTKTMWVNCHQRNSTGTCRWHGLIVILNLFFQGCGHTRVPLL